ncbi:glycosyltransferase [Verticiella sediminum]|uniref:Glycosyltransferase n=1 Tax=Verticiella sediminum TaxID=1247510 RepID=A0A556AC46_9BURK|nr:glycosyltransferase [Verticiella sediminum]TSH90459.1 glycosyltransferase [Verticiella sediminum]
MTELHWSIDSLAVRENVVFGFGWAFHPSLPITSMRVVLSCPGEGPAQSIAAEHGKPREDVGQAHPEAPTAASSGFLVYGGFQGRAPVSALLEVGLADGSVIELPIPPSRLAHSGGRRAADKRAAMRQAGQLLRRAVGLVRAGQFGSLLDKARRYLKGRPAGTLDRPAALAGRLHRDELRDLCVIVDHDLGGGANHYRTRLVDDMLAQGRTVLILTYHVATLTHMVIVRNRRLDERLAIPDKAFFVEAVAHLPVTEIIYNTGVSFARPEEIPLVLLELKQRTGARLRVLGHDFYMVCPSHFLIDVNGAYCGVPGLDACARCLPDNPHGFATLFAERDMAKWRSLWGALLAGADEIVVFSNSTAGLLRRVYPQIGAAQVSVVPHQVTYLRVEPPRVTNTATLRIGVVGQIGFHKGASFVKALGEEVARRGLDARIVVIGSIESNCDAAVLSQTGPYRHDELPGLLERSGANIMLFPSIWPETFSYVVQELMDMGLPVAAFDFGAPAERLATYARGCVLDSMDPARVLDQLISFHRKIYLAH